MIFSGLSQCSSGPPVIVYVSAQNGLPVEEVTWAKMLQSYGYRTAAVGKLKILSVALACH